MIPFPSTLFGNSGFGNWNPADTSTGVLSNFDLTYTANISGTPYTRATFGASAGKFYFEVLLSLVNASTLTGFGIATKTATYANMQASGLNCAMLTNFGANSPMYVNGTQVISNLGASNNNHCGCAINFATQLIWFRPAPASNWNNSGTANPATGTGGQSISGLSGSLFPFCTINTGHAGSNSMTANFGASAFSGTAPTGFNPGWPN